MKVEEHLITKKYLKEHSLVESNIISFNNFIEEKMQQIVNDLNESISSEEIEIKLGRIRMDKPNIVEADGSISLIIPTEARLRNLTYSAPIFLEISIKQGQNTESHEVEIGRMPVMVKSKVCNIYGKTREELEKEYIDPNDPGGYFIINGNERAMVLTEDLASNQTFIEKKKDKIMLRLFSQR